LVRSLRNQSAEEPLGELRYDVAQQVVNLMSKDSVDSSIVTNILNLMNGVEEQERKSNCLWYEFKLNINKWLQTHAMKPNQVANKSE